MTDDAVIASTDGRIGHILLNRPQALNALSREMIGAVGHALDAWRDDPEIHSVVIEGAGERAFCAGGDIRAVRDLGLAGDREAIEAFFRDEYALNLAIAQYPKPYAALIDGICMGGGMGLAVHGQVRATTEAGSFAMPETGIAMFPDVGASFFLPRLPGCIGIYLGLTGTRLTGADAVHAGLATHLVPGSALVDLRAAIARDGIAEVAVYAQSLPPFSLAPHRAAIDRCFGADSVLQMIARLDTEDTDFGRDTLATLRRRSPSAVLWSFEMMRRGRHLSLREALQGELRMTRRVIPHREFAEGVRAMVVDKDRAPRWDPARIEDVDPAAIAAMFD
jgi:enoyl-CoA hydratase